MGGEVVLGGNFSVNHQCASAVKGSRLPCVKGSLACKTDKTNSLVLVMFHLEFRISCSMLHAAGENREARIAGRLRKPVRLKEF